MYSLITIGADLSKNDVPLAPYRRAMIRFILVHAARVQLWCCNIKVKPKILNPDDLNYSYYLGKNYRAEYKDPCNKKRNGKVSLFVANHSSFIDIIAMISALEGHVAFVAGDHTLGLPGLCRLVKAIGCITMPMGGSKEALEQT